MTTLKRCLEKRAVAWGLALLVLGVLPAAAWAGESQEGGDSLQVDRLWVVIAAGMVFLMQAGFLCLEVGGVRPKAATITALKNVVDWTVCAVTFYFVGWGLMFGHTSGGWIGGDFFALNGRVVDGQPIGIGFHFLYQLAFAGTAATIVSGALAERTGFMSYFIFSAVITAIIYPIAGHWVWGNGFFAGQHSWLTERGFIDFAGSTQVHSIGGWAALMGIIVVGPRLGRFDEGKVREWEVTGLHWTAFGVLILWFSWWGFNGGSTLALNEDVWKIIINTNVAGALGGVGGMFYSYVFNRGRGISGAFLNGILAGLVGITASCHMVDPARSVLIGMSSGIISAWGSELLLKLRWDDPVGAVPVHLFCGVWGTLCVGLFGDSAKYTVKNSWIEQIGVQILGIAAVGALTVGVSYVTFKFLKGWIGLRVSPEEEQYGFDIAGVTDKPAGEQLGEEEIRKLLAGSAK